MRLAGSLRDDASTAVHQELAVTALFLVEGSTSVIIISCDLILLPPEDAWEFRSAVGAALNISPEHVLLAVSHSHATPSPPSWGEYDYEATSEERADVASFFDALQNAMMQAAEQALRKAQPVRIASGSGESDININRRERRPDGAMVLGANPHGPADQEVGVLRLDTEAGEPLALLFNYACHPDVLGPKSQLISPDFVGPARDAAEAVTSATSLFLQGAAGDIYPCTGIVNGSDGVDAASRLGHRLGAEAARVSETLATRRQPGRRVEWISTASVTTSWEYEDVPVPAPGSLAVGRTVLDMPLRELPSEEEAAELLQEFEAGLAQVSNSPSLSARLIAHRRVAWARLQYEAIGNGKALSVPLEIQAVRIGDCAIVAIPGELFTEIGLAIKAVSPFANTMVSAYSNGVYFYIPTKAAFEEGGYEINSHRNYMRASGPTAEWEDVIVHEAQLLLSRLA